MSWRAGELGKSQLNDSTIQRTGAPFAAGAIAVLVFLLGALSIPALASLSVGRVEFSSPKSSVRPGESVTIVWGAFPEGTQEFEILLCGESPVVQTLRLTDQLDPDLGRYAWTVPNVPWDTARIRIRAGIEGLGETTWAVSAPFKIAWEPDIAVQRATFREGEWWAADEPDSPSRSFTTNTPASINPLPIPPAGAESTQTERGAALRGSRALSPEQASTRVRLMCGRSVLNTTSPELRLRI